jgi:excisionase family DNA binding protein
MDDFMAFLDDHIDPSEPLPTLLRPSEVAVRLGVSRTWLYDAAKDRRIPSIRLGAPDGPLRFVPDDLRAWIALNRRAAPDARHRRSRDRG